MGGFSRLAGVASLAVVLTANARTPDLETGRSIYLNGVGRDPITIEMFGQPVTNTSTFSCAACHGEFGAGASEGGIAAPSLIADGLADDALKRWLDRALDPDGAAPGPAIQRMPRYRMSARDRDALAGYIRTLPDPSVPGLDNGSLVVGLDVTGMGLDQAGRAALMNEMTGLFGKLAGYGLYGRRIVVRDITGQPDQVDVFAAILWDARAATKAPLRIAVRPPPVAGELQLCGSVQPPLSDQYEMLTRYLDRRGERYHTVWNGVDPPFKLSLPDSSDKEDVITHDVEIDLRATPPAPGTRPIYVFGDLIGPHAMTELQDNVHLILPARIPEQELAARDIQSRNPIDPRSAGSIAMMKNAANALLGTLIRSGRRISVRETCDGLAKAMARIQHLDGMNKGTVIQISP